MPAGPSAYDRPLTRLQRRRHNKQLVDCCDGSQSALVARSVLGLVRVYNLLPQTVVNARSVKNFQKRVQTAVRTELKLGTEEWQTCLSTTTGGNFNLLQYEP